MQKYWPHERLDPRRCVYAPWSQKEPREQKTSEAKTEEQETKETKAEEQKPEVQSAPSLSLPLR